LLAILGAPCTSYVCYQRTLYAVHVPPSMAAAPAMSLQTFFPTGGTQGLKSVLPPLTLFSIAFSWLSVLHNGQKSSSNIEKTIGGITVAAVHLSGATSSAETPPWLQHFSGHCHSSFTCTNQENKNKHGTPPSPSPKHHCTQTQSLHKLG
jgi:hypothetical protein